MLSWASGRDGWRLVDGNYGGATQIYGEIRLPPKKRECRMQTNSLLIPPNLTTMLYCWCPPPGETCESEINRKLHNLFRLSLCAEINDAWAEQQLRFCVMSPYRLSRGHCGPQFEHPLGSGLVSYPLLVPCTIYRCLEQSQGLEGKSVWSLPLYVQCKTVYDGCDHLQYSVITCRTLWSPP